MLTFVGVVDFGWTLYWFIMIPSLKLTCNVENELDSLSDPEIDLATKIWILTFMAYPEKPYLISQVTYYIRFHKTTIWCMWLQNWHLSHLMDLIFMWMSFPHTLELYSMGSGLVSIWSHFKRRIIPRLACFRQNAVWNWKELALLPSDEFG